MAYHTTDCVRSHAAKPGRRTATALGSSDFCFRGRYADGSALGIGDAAPRPLGSLGRHLLHEGEHRFRVIHIGFEHAHRSV